MMEEERLAKHPLLSWDISGYHYFDGIAFSRKSSDLRFLMRLAVNNDWDINWRKELTSDYDALILTDADQTIQWVNDGFEPMTGYTPEYAMGKTPRFLQGEKTSHQTRSRIRGKLENQKRLQESVVNYRKNGELYRCRIDVLPIFNKKKDLTHFVAIEKEIELH